MHLLHFLLSKRPVQSPVGESHRYGFCSGFFVKIFGLHVLKQRIDAGERVDQAGVADTCPERHGFIESDFRELGDGLEDPDSWRNFGEDIWFFYC